MAPSLTRHRLKSEEEEEASELKTGRGRGDQTRGWKRNPGEGEHWDVKVIHL